LVLVDGGGEGGEAGDGDEDEERAARRRPHRGGEGLGVELRSDGCGGYYCADCSGEEGLGIVVGGCEGVFVAARCQGRGPT
jgi:hypothetical protein